jgi:acyl carrier protein
MSNDLTERVISVIATTQRIPREKISPESTFEELGLDSLDSVNILFALEEEFKINIPDDDAREIRGVKQMVEGIEKLVAASGGAS